MSSEILINVTARETRIALVENSILQDIYIERANNLRLVGNIYKGKVVRVLPGMQAAFIDIGLDRTAFLHESDLSAQQQAVVRGQAPQFARYAQSCGDHADGRDQAVAPGQDGFSR